MTPALLPSDFYDAKPQIPLKHYGFGNGKAGVQELQIGYVCVMRRRDVGLGVVERVLDRCNPLPFAASFTSWWRKRPPMRDV